MKNTTCRPDPSAFARVRDRSVDENCQKYSRILGVKLGVAKAVMESFWTLVNWENSRRVRLLNFFVENR